MALIRAAGYIIFRESPCAESTYEYLLMQSSYGNHHWTPPKGRLEKDENPEEAALRELQEESGLKKEQIYIYKNFKKTLNYQVDGKDKEVIYWLAKLKSPTDQIELSEEHQDHKWLAVQLAVQTAHYQDMKDLIVEAEGFLKNHGE